MAYFIYIFHNLYAKIPAAQPKWGKWWVCRFGTSDGMGAMKLLHNMQNPGTADTESNGIW